MCTICVCAIAVCTWMRDKGLRVSIAVRKHQNRKHLREKDLFQLTAYSPSYREVKGSHLEAGADAEVMVEVLLSGLLSMA